METGLEAMDVIHLIGVKVRCWSLTNTVMDLWVPDKVNFFMSVKRYKRAASVERLLACQVVVQIYLMYVTQYL